MKKYSLIILSTLFWPRPLTAASFPCNKAGSEEEKAVCADRGLNDMDVEMSVKEGSLWHGNRGRAQGLAKFVVDKTSQWLCQ